MEYRILTFDEFRLELNHAYATVYDLRVKFRPSEGVVILNGEKVYIDPGSTPTIEPLLSWEAVLEPNEGSALQAMKLTLQKFSFEGDRHYQAFSQRKNVSLEINGVPSERD